MMPWSFGAVDLEAEMRLVKRLALSPVTAQILVARGFDTPERARAFLHPDLRQAPDPALMLGMEEAIRRVARALERDERILVYGDYDVDGQASIALMVRTLRMLGGRAAHYVPHRVDEGYGLHPEAVEGIANSGIRLMITVDCGITGAAEVELATRLGLDVIITDHHQPPDELPRACAVLNPHREGCPYPDKELAGVGVSYKLARALAAHLGGSRFRPSDVDALLDLVALGTVADSVPLVGENRALVRAGLERMNHSPVLGLGALIEAAGLAGSEVGAGQVAWTLGPRINAIGRMDDAALGVRLLLTGNAEEAAHLAQLLDEQNARRQRVEADVLEAARAQIEERRLQVTGEGEGAGPVGLVASGDAWHPGVIGIAASRLVERYGCPAIVLSIEGDEAKGSGRSIPGVNLYEALKACGGLLTRYGGHPMAAGLRLPRSHIEPFAERFARVTEEQMRGRPRELRLRVDGLVTIPSLTREAVQELSQLGPHGVGNPSPTLLTDALRARRVRAVGKDGRHLKLELADREERCIDAIGFSMTEEWMPKLAGAAEAPGEPAPHVQVAAVPELNVWRGRPRVQLRLRALRSAHTGSAVPNPANGGMPADPAPASGLNPAPDRVPKRPRGWEAVCWEIAAAADLDPWAGEVRERRPPHLHDARGVSTPHLAAVRLFWAALEGGSGAAPLFRLFLRTRLSAYQVARTLWEGHPDLRPFLRIDGRTVLLAAPPASEGRPPPSERAPDDDGDEGGGWRGPGSTLLFLQLPPDPQTLTRQPAGADTVWCLYGEDDAARGEQELRRAYPDRGQLAHLYRACSQSASANGGCLEGLEGLVVRATRLGGERVWPETVQAGLRIFSELGLVRSARADGTAVPGGCNGEEEGPSSADNVQLKLVAKPVGKLDLATSLRYNEGVRARRLFAEAAELGRRPQEALQRLFEPPFAS